MLFGDKTAARSRAREVGVPVLPGTPGGTSLEAARAFLGEHGAVMVKAVAGGGGRGMRPVTREQDLAEAMRRCASEAAASFGDGSLYVEQLLPLARHVEVQVIGDGTGAIAVLGDRDCSIELAARERLPVVMFAEGGGGRPGDTDTTAVAQLEVPTFRLAAQLSGKVPLVAVVTGYCFAGNAALASACDLIVATADASLGMGGPAMIEGGGLGVVPPGEVGPMSVQVPNGVVDVLVGDEAAAVAVARRYLRCGWASAPSSTRSPIRRPGGPATRSWWRSTTPGARP